ncbi:MAG: hypothetical protein ACR2O3_01245 [Rhizobiaceae bacterium]
MAKLKTGLHKPPASNRPTRRNTSRKGASDKKNEANRNKSENPDNAELQLKDIEHVLREHGVKIEDLKGFWDQISAELKDLPTKKPLVTALGAFLLGFLAGRLSRK